MREYMNRRTLLGIIVFVLAVFCAVNGMSHTAYAKTEEYKRIHQVDYGDAYVVKVGNYYYWTKNSWEEDKFEILRAKKKGSKGTVIFQSKGRFAGVDNGWEYSMCRYEYADIYTNGKNIVLCEQDGKDRKVRYYCIDIKSKSKKLLMEVNQPFYDAIMNGIPLSYAIPAVYGNYAYCTEVEKTPTWEVITRTYKVSLDGKKKTRYADLDYFVSDSVFDGKWLYKNGKKYDLEKKVKKSGPKLTYMTGRDGEVYAVVTKGSGSKAKKSLRPVKNNVLGKKLCEWKADAIFDSNIGPVTESHIYFYTYTYDNDGTSTARYYRINRTTGRQKELSYEQYCKEIY